MAEKVIVELEIDTATGKAKVKDLEDTVSGANDELKDTSGAVSGLTKKLDEMTGGAVSGFKKFVAGAKAGIGTMNGLKVAIAATGIGALLIAITSLSAFFTKTEKGAQSLRVIMAALGAVMNEVGDVFVKIGETIFDAITKPQEAFDSFIQSIKDFLSDPIGTFDKLIEGAKDSAIELERDTRAAIALENQLNNIKVAERGLTVERAKSRSEIEALRSVGQDLANSTEVRVSALQKAADIEEQLLEKELDIARQRLQIIKDQNALSSSGESDLDAEAEAQARLFELQSESVSRTRRVQLQLGSLREQAKQEQIKDLEELELARLTATEKEIQEVRTKYQNLLDLARKYNQDTAELEMRRLEELRELQQQGLEIRRGTATAELNLEKRKLAEGTAAVKVAENAKTKFTKAESQARLGVVANALSAVGGLINKESAAGKALAVAVTTIDTYRAAVSAFAQTPGGIVIKSVAAAAAAAFGAIQIKNILKTKIPGASGGGGGGSAPSIGAPPRSASIGLISPNATAGEIGGSLTQSLNDRPPKAYVVASEIESGLQLENEIKANGSL